MSTHAMLKKGLFLFVVSFLTACGGGGGGTTPPPLAPTTQSWPDSPTRFCTDGSNAIACPGGVSGQDGHYAINVPTYTTTTETVTDSASGLVWQRNPPFTALNKAAALTYCDNLVLEGMSDWRMPTRLELTSIVDAGRVVPPYETTAFPGIPSNSFFWTSTAYAADSTRSFVINTNYPVTYIFNNTTATEEIVRCVRGTGFTGSLTVAGGSVTDSTTGLVWESGTNAATMSWQNALAYCEGLTLDGVSTWRLPSQKELSSIVDDTRTAPAISTAFSSRPATVFWTSTPVPIFPSTAYVIDFNTGGNSGIVHPFTNLRNVRCVH